MMRQNRLSAITALIGVVTATATTLYAAAPYQKEPVIVTATRTAQTVDSALASVTVISREDIERQQARSIQDLFRGLPGINIANNGGPGKNTSIFMRGTESDHVLVMIDNIKVGSATTGTTAFENIPLEQIERIEIVRGPRSSLYGSEAIGGVIHIFTRKGDGKAGFRPHFSFGGGSYGTLNGSAGFSASYGKGWLNLTASGKGTNGFNACRGKPSPGGAGCFTNEPDRDGYRNVSGSVRAGYRFDNGLDISANFMQSEGRTQFDGSFTNKTETMQQVVGGTAHYSPLKFWRIKVSGGRSRQDSDNFLGSVFSSRFNTTRDTISIQNDFTVNKNNLLTLGMDYWDDQIKSTESFDENSRTNWGAFSQHQTTIGAFDGQLSGRIDSNEQFGTHLTGGIGAGYAITDKIRFTANFGTAFKAPTFNQLYFPNFGNPNLNPEKSRSLEFGVRGNMNWGKWAVNIYETHIDNLIVNVSDSATGFFLPKNVSKARIRGLEAILSTQIKGWQLNGNLTFMDPENRASANNPELAANRGNILPRRARESFRLDADRRFGRYRVGATLLVEGKRFDNTENTRKLDSYVKFDLRAEYALNKNWRLQGRIENLFNERYETASFFNQPGRNFFALLRYQPG